MKAMIDLGNCPGLTAAQIVRVLVNGLGEEYEVSEAGRLMVPDVVVKRTNEDGAAVQILRQRLRKRTRLRVYGMAPSLAQRAWTPVGLYRQSQVTKSTVEVVATVLEASKGTLSPQTVEPD